MLLLLLSCYFGSLLLCFVLCCLFVGCWRDKSSQDGVLGSSFTHFRGSGTSEWNPWDPLVGASESQDPQNGVLGVIFGAQGPQNGALGIIFEAQGSQIGGLGGHFGRKNRGVGEHWRQLTPVLCFLSDFTSLFDSFLESKWSRKLIKTMPNTGVKNITKI